MTELQLIDTQLEYIEVYHKIQDLKKRLATLRDVLTTKAKPGRYKYTTIYEASRKMIHVSAHMRNAYVAVRVNRKVKR